MEKEFLEPSPRYHANPAEQQILIQGLQRYFFFPERSQNRNKIARDVSNLLRCYSPHWTHRAVRLWFNNNRHTYLNYNPELWRQQILNQQGFNFQIGRLQQMMKMNPPQTVMEKQDIKLSPEQGEINTNKTQIQQVQENNVDQQKTNKYEEVPQNNFEKEEIHTILEPTKDNSFQIPVKKSPISVVNPIYMVPIQIPSIHSLKNDCDKSQFADFSESMKKMEPISFQKNTTKEPSIGDTYATVAALWNAIEHMKENDPKRSQAITDFDEKCNNLIAKHGPIQPEKIHPMLSSIKFPFKEERSLDFSGIDLSYDFSASDADSLFRTPSITNQILNVKDNYSKKNIWNNRPFTDQNVMYFDCTTLSNQYAAIVMVPMGSSQKSLSVNSYHEKNSTWEIYNVDLPNRIESMALGSNNAWLLSSKNVVNIPFSQTIKTQIAEIPDIPGNRCITSFNSGCVINFSSSSKIHFLNEVMSETVIETPYCGISALAATHINLMCAISGSCSLRLINTQGQEIRTFVGHCAPVNGVVHLGNEIYASYASDSTVRVWDSRQYLPITTITAFDSSVVCLSGTPDYVICGFHNKKIGVIDLRKPLGKAILGINIQDYEPINMYYDQSYDSLAMFGATPIGNNNDSFRFFETDKSQRVFRTYQNFIGLNSKD